jgi:hypothetical protein
VEIAQKKTGKPVSTIQPAASVKAVPRRSHAGTASLQLSTARLSSPHDPAEKDAEATAKTIMRMAGTSQNIRRTACGECSKTATCRTCAARMPDTVQRKAEQPSGRARTSFVERFAPDLGSGRPLDASTRAFFEPRFEQDLSEVRVHTGAKAAESARAVNALAYTVEQDIVFGAEQYSPGTSGGRLLLAHELAHVVQQGASKVSGSANCVQIQRREEQSFPIAGAPLFSGCSPYERFRLEQQVSRALGMIRTAQTAVAEEIARPDRATGIITIAGSAINRYFHTSEKGHIRTVLTRLQRIGDRLGRSPQNWRCLTEAACRDRCGIAAACTDPANPIFLCPVHFMEPDTQGAFVLIHEAAHQAGMGLGWGVQREIYESEEKFAGLSIEQALDTPDSYRALVRDLMYGGPLSLSRAWTPFEMSIRGEIEKPLLAVEFFISRLGGVTRVPSLIPAGTVVENGWRGVFVFDAGDSPRRPTILTNPEVGLKIVLRRSASAPARLGRPVESALFDRAGRAAPNEVGRIIPPGTAKGYEFDFSFDAADRGTLDITAQIRDEDAGATLTYRDRVAVRPTSPPGSRAGGGTPSSSGTSPAAGGK